VDEINRALRKPAVATKQGGSEGGGTTLTPVGEQVIGLYHKIESRVGAKAGREFRAITKLVQEV
jgi:molybdate transport system regulatory protein